MEVIFAWLFAFVFNMGVVGIYLGLVVGMQVGSIIGYVYVNYFLKRHEGYFRINS